MIEADRADHGDIRVDDVGGVESTAEPHFENHHVDARTAEMIQRRECVVFEERERDVGADCVDARECFDEARVARLDAVHADSFVVAREMRRSEPPAAKAGGAQQRVEAGDGRSLAVGAADGDHAAIRREQVEPPCDFAHAAQAEIYGAGM